MTRRGPLTSSQWRDWLTVDRTTAATTAEHAALHAKLSAAPTAMHDSSVDDLSDHAPAHQARKIGLDDTPAVQWRHNRRPIPCNCDCHDGPPQVGPAHAYDAAVQRIPIVGPWRTRCCPDADETSVPQVTFPAGDALLSSVVTTARHDRSSMGETDICSLHDADSWAASPRQPRRPRCHSHRGSHR